MLARLHALERAYTRERLELAYRPVIEDIVRLWGDWTAEAEWAVGPAMHAVRLLEEAGVFIPAAGFAVNYLQRCALDGEPPGARHLLTLLLIM